MYVIVAPLQIKQGHKEEFIQAMLENAQSAVNSEPGCLRFDVIQDAGDANRVWLYEIYTDEAAFQAHLQAPHFSKCMNTIKDLRDEGLQGAARGSYNIWPPDSEWK